MAKRVIKRKQARPSQGKPDVARASGKMPVETELVATVKMPDGDPAYPQPKAQPPFRRSLIN